MAGESSIRDNKNSKTKLEAQLRELQERLEKETQRRRSLEDELAGQQGQLQLLMESTRVIPWEADAASWGFIYVGPTAEGLLGFPIERWHEKDFWVNRIHPEDRELATNICQQFSQTGDEFEFEYRMLTAGDQIVWIHDVVSVLRVEGVPSRLRGFMIDITGRKQKEAAVADREHRYEQLMESAPDPIILSSPEGRIKLVNRRAEEVFGHEREEMIGEKIEMLMPERFRDRHGRGREAFAFQPRVRAFGPEVNLFGLRKDGTEFPVEIAISPHQTDEGLLVCASLRDVTARKESEAALVHTEQQLRLIADSLPVLISYVDHQRRYQFNNAAYERWFGLSQDRIVGRTIWEVHGKEAYDAIQTQVDRALSGEEVTYETDIATQDGGTCRVEAIYVPNIEPAGQVVGFFALVREVAISREPPS